MYKYTGNIQIYRKYTNIQELYKYTENMQIYRKYTNIQLVIGTHSPAGSPQRSVERKQEIYKRDAAEAYEENSSG